jgi:hypothetical protein
MCITITKELVLEPKPQMSRGAATFLNDLQKIRGDHVGVPTKDDGIHPGPAWVIGESVVRLDVVGEGIYISTGSASSCHITGRSWRTWHPE